MKKRLAKFSQQKLRKPEKPTVSFALISQAAKETPYSGEYLSLLVRKGKIAGRKFGRNWYVAKKDLEKYLRERQAEQVQGYRPVVSLASIPFSPLNPITPIEGVKRDERGEKGKNQDLSTDIKKELDELEELYRDTNTRMRANDTNEEKTEPINSISPMHPRFAFPRLPAEPDKSDRTNRTYMRGVEVAIVAVVTLVIILGGFNLKFANALYNGIKDFVNDAMTLQGHVPGTHANEILLLDKEGKISIYGHIETQGQFRSYAKDGIAPIVVDSKTTAENLSADYLDNLSAQDFTLELVTKHGNITFNNVQLEGGAEVGKLLLVKGAAQFLDYVSVAKNLSVGQSVSVGQDLVVNGISTLAGKLNALGGALFTGRVEVKGDIDATGFIAAQRGQIKEGGLVVSGSTQLNTLGVTGGASMSDLGISGNFSVAGKEISLGDSGADKMNVNASSTFKGPFEVVAYEAKFGRGIEILANGLTVAGAAGITGNTTITGNLTVSGSSSYGLNFGVGTTTPGGALGVKGAGLFDGFVMADYFTSTSTATSWLMGAMGIGTTTPGAKMGVEGDGLFKGGLYAQATTTTSSLIATSTLEVRGASGSDLVVTDGNIGIGTSTPGNLFSVHGNGNFQNNLTVENILKAGSLISVTQTVSGGSTSSPAYAFNGDTNTGFTSGGGDDYLSLITGGIVRLGIDKTGRVGVGTTTPGSLLSVQGVGNIGELTVEGPLKFSYFISTSTTASYMQGALGLGTTTPGGALGVKGAGLFDGFVSADYFTSTSTNSSWIFGNLGVGTTTPGAKLAIDGDASLDGLYAMGTTTTSSLIATSTLEVRGATGNDFAVGDGRVGLGSTTPNATQVISNDASNSAADLLQLVNSVGTYNFVVTNGGSVGIGMYNPSGYLTVYGNTYLAATEGNVGIGETSPGAKLSVSGGLAVGSGYDTTTVADGNVIISGNVGVGTTTPAKLLQLASTGSAQLMLTDSDAADDLKHWFASSTDGSLSWGSANDRLTSWTERIRMDSSGNLGVGTTTPGYRFASEGDGLFKGGLYVQATSTMSSLIATSTLEVRSSAYTGGLLLAAFKEKVGFGTSTPGSLLSVHGVGNIGELTVEGLFKGGTLTATSSVIAALGAVGSPSYTFLGDTNTGLWSSAADTFNISTGGAERVRVTSDGNVGVGVTSPIVAFHVAGQCVTGDTKLRRRRRKRKGQTLKNQTLKKKKRSDLKDVKNQKTTAFSAAALGGLKPVQEPGSSTSYTSISATKSVSSMPVETFGTVEVTGIEPASPWLTSLDSNQSTPTAPSFYHEDEPYIYDEVAIKDIQSGDEIQSLNEATGQLVWSKVRALMDMGVKPIFKLSTATGKTIRTTGNHPYYVRVVFGNKNLALANEVLPNFSAMREAGLGIGLSISGRKTVSSIAGDSFSGGPAEGFAPSKSGLPSPTSHYATGPSLFYHETKKGLTLETAPRSNLETDSGGWVEVKYLSVGMDIAIAGDNNQNAIWDKIIKIEKLPAEQVYDIEVEGTHNFVGNDIVAHNTYIRDDLSISGGDLNLGGANDDGISKATSTIKSLGGKLGIYDNAQASTTPGAILSIHANTTTPAFLLNQAGAGDLFTLQDSGATEFTVHDGGNVGVATTSDSAELTVAGNVRLLGSSNSAGAISAGSIIFGDSSLAWADIRRTYAGNNLVIDVWSGSAWLTPLTILSASGNVGISTIAPKTALHVVGDGTFNFSAIGDGLGDINVLGGNINLGNDGKATSTITSLGGRLSIYDNAQASTSPGAILSIHANTTTPAFLLNQAGAGDLMEVQDNGVTVFKVQDGGNIGFSTSSPGANLSIGSGATALFSSTATTTFSGGLNIKDTGGLSSATGLTITGGDILSSGKLTLTGASTSTIPQLNASTILTVPTLDISTILKNSGTATSSFAGGLAVGTGGLNVTSGGLYVDVGDVTFDQKLVVNGNVGIGTTTPSDTLAIQSATSYDGLTVYNSTQVTSIVMGTGASNSGARNWAMNTNLVNWGDLVFSVGAGQYHDPNSPSATRVLSLQPGGNVGIGTTSPPFLFTVAGSGYISSGLLVGASPTGGDKGAGTINVAGDIYKNGTAYNNPDYVFEKYFTGKIEKFAGNDGASTYTELKPLDEVVSFVSSNYQLPLLANSDGGIFGRGDALLASVEEAYLYLFKLNSKVDSAFTVDSAGNITLGGPSLGGNVNILAQCVTGDTLLPIRRRRKNKRPRPEIEPALGTKGQDSTTADFEYLSVQIKDVLAGDEVMSLDETAGRVRYALVNGLMDMGVQEIFELVTRSGRKIRTTANHPYLTQISNS